MNLKPIILIDDDLDDLDIMKDAFSELGVENEIITFTDGHKFLEFMQTNGKGIFFILCDVNMSPLNGLMLREQAFSDAQLRLKCTPFIFMSTSGSSDAVMKAYSFGAQGYFEKPTSFSGLKNLLQSILAYWDQSVLPKC